MREDSPRQSARNLFFLYSYALSVYGVWPLLDDTLFLKCRIALVVCQMTMLATTGTIKLITQCGSSEEMIDTFLMLVVSLLLLAKCCLLYLHRDKLAFIIRSSTEDWIMVENAQYKKMMSERRSFCETVAKMFYSGGLFVLAIYLAKILIFDEINVIDEESMNSTSVKLQRRYLFPDGCVFDGIGNYLYYLIITNQAIQMSITVSINLGGDTLYVALTLHLCEQCEIMKLKFKSFGQYDSLEKNHEHLKALISRHQKLMIRAEKLEDIYNEIILMQMLMSIMLISVAGFSFLVSLNDGEMLAAAKNICLMQFMLAQSYIYTFPADDLKDQADGLLHALYSSQWCDMPAHIMKDIGFMMMRINVPPYYTAGKFFYLTKQSYMTVVKTAASYLSVLRIMIK